MKTQHCLPILIIAGLWSYPREGFTEEFDTTLLAGESAKGIFHVYIRKIHCRPAIS